MRVRARRVLSAVSGSIVAVTCLGAVLPAAAGAEATVGPPAKASSVTGLPDGRVYEQVSPANKYGNSVVADFLVLGTGLARADGNAVMYTGDGALAEQSTSGNDFAPFVSRRTSNGWSTRSAMPIGAKGLRYPEENNNIVVSAPHFMLPSADLSHLAFTTERQAAYAPPPDRLGLNTNFFLAGPDPLSEASVWVARPQVPEAVEGSEEVLPIGGSQDLSTLYFSYTGTLLPEDDSRVEGEGFYEYRDGVLSEAGVLPDGSISPSGATPASQGSNATLGRPQLNNPDQFDNVVSVDGSRAFFLSVDPAVGVQELYVRETAPDGAKRTLLVSESQVEGQVRKPAPTGPVAFANTAPGPLEGRYGFAERSSTSYVYASPDGSHAFFQSTDRLTGDAPGDESVKTYDFDVEAGSLEYLPGVVGSPVVSVRDGSSLIFENTSTMPFELERWSAGPADGSVTEILELPAPDPGFLCSVVCVGPARISLDGRVAVFETNSPIPGFNGGGYGQIFRYDGGSNEVSCLSCPPSDVVPSGDALMSYIDKVGMNVHHSLLQQYWTGPGERGMSADGSRAFFDTAEALVPQDLNGKRDVYEWEGGKVFLVSSGTSPEDSDFFDSSESGDDVFFATSSKLEQGDDDGAYDVYDARVPRPGDSPPPSSVPCQGDVCQGPPSVPELLGAPASATFNGLGNLPPQAETQPTVKAKTKAKAKKRAKRGKKKSAKRRAGRKASKHAGAVQASKGRSE